MLSKSHKNVKHPWANFLKPWSSRVSSYWLTRFQDRLFWDVSFNSTLFLPLWNTGQSLDTQLCLQSRPYKPSFKILAMPRYHHHSHLLAPEKLRQENSTFEASQHGLHSNSQSRAAQGNLVSKQTKFWLYSPRLTPWRIFAYVSLSVNELLFLLLFIYYCYYYWGKEQINWCLTRPLKLF